MVLGLLTAGIIGGTIARWITGGLGETVDLVYIDNDSGMEYRSSVAVNYWDMFGRSKEFYSMFSADPFHVIYELFPGNLPRITNGTLRIIVNDRPLVEKQFTTTEHPVGSFRVIKNFPVLDNIDSLTYLALFIGKTIERYIRTPSLATVNKHLLNQDIHSHIQLFTGLFYYSDLWDLIQTEILPVIRQLPNSPHVVIDVWYFRVSEQSIPIKIGNTILRVDIDRSHNQYAVWDPSTGPQVIRRNEIHSVLQQKLDETIKNGQL
jgi:hypothetical protein